MWAQVTRIEAGLVVVVRCERGGSVGVLVGVLPGGVLGLMVGSMVKVAWDYSINAFRLAA